MAIKGKRRSKGGKTRARAGAPRPTLVTPKPALVRRPWFRVTVVAVLVLAAAGIAFAIVAARRAAAERQAAREEVQRVGALLDGAVIEIAQQIPGGGLVVLPEVGQTLSEITTGDARPPRVERDVAGWEEDLQAASERLADIRTERRDLRRAIRQIREGLDLYVGVVGELPETARLRGDARAEAAAGLQERLATAAGAVESGWLIYRNERVDVGLDENRPGVQTELPPGMNPFAPPGPGEVPIPEPSS